MGNNLEFILSLTDKFSTAMQAAGSVSSNVASRITNDINRANQSSRQMALSVNELRQRLEAVNQVRFGTRITSEFNAATRQARDLERQIERLEGRGSGGGLGGLIPGIGIAAGIGSAIKASAEADMSKVSYSTLLGSKEKGAAMYKDLNQFGNETVFDNQSVYKDANTLLAFGIAGDKIMPTMRMLGDVSMGDAEKMSSLTLAFAQTQTAGKLMGQDLMQYTNAGFSPLNEISKMTGIKLADLRKEMEKGAITSDMVTAAFQHATASGGLFHDALKNAADTVTGKWGIFMGSVQTKLISLGNLLSPITKGVLDFGASIFDDTPSLIAFTVAIGAVTLALSWSSLAAKGMAMWTGIMNAVMTANPIGLVVAALAVLVTGIVYAYNHFEKFRGFLWGSSAALTSFANLIKDFVIDKITGMVKGITGLGETLYLFFTGQWKKAWETGKQATQDIIGVDAVTHAIANGKKIGSAFSTGYKDGVGDFIKHKGVNPNNANAAGSAAGVSADTFKDLGASTSKKAKSVNDGGQRSIVINIGKQIEKLEIHVMDAKEGVNEIESMVRESMKRLLYGINGVAS